MQAVNNVVSVSLCGIKPLNTSSRPYATRSEGRNVTDWEPSRGIDLPTGVHRQWVPGTMCDRNLRKHRSTPAFLLWGII